jgi:hypothetical protein
MDQWHRQRTFPNTEELQRYGHNISKLYKWNEALFPYYQVKRPTKDELDPINQELLIFLTAFANGSRYFNLDTLSAPAKAADPIVRLETLFYRVYDQDAPESKEKSGLDSSTEEFEPDTIRGIRRGL